MPNSADPDQLASPTDPDLHCLQKQGLSGFSRIRVKALITIVTAVDDILTFFYFQRK